MKQSTLSRLLVRTILLSWKNRMLIVLRQSPAAPVGGLCFAVLLLLLMWRMSQQLSQYLSGAPEDFYGILVRNVGPLVVGVALFLTWTLHLLSANTLPATGLQNLPFMKKHWQQALAVILNAIVLVGLLLFLGPLIWTILGQATPNAWQFAVLIGVAMLNLVVGILLGNTLYLFVELLAGRFSVNHRTRQAISYLVFIFAMVFAMAGYAKLAFFGNGLGLRFLPGSGLSMVYQAFDQNLAPVIGISVVGGSISALLVVRKLIYHYSQLEWPSFEGSEVGWTKYIRLPWRRSFWAVFSITLSTLLRNAETMLMVLSALSIPLLAGILFRLFDIEQMKEVYASVIWLLLSLGVAGLGIVARSCLSAARPRLYFKPLAASVLVAGQLLAVLMLGVLLASSGFVICSWLAELSLSWGVVGQFVRLTILSLCLAYVIGCLLGSDRNKLGYGLPPFSAYVFALMPLMSLDQWLRTQTLAFQIVLPVFFVYLLFESCVRVEEKAIVV